MVAVHGLGLEQALVEHLEDVLELGLRVKLFLELLEKNIVALRVDVALGTQPDAVLLAEVVLEVLRAHVFDDLVDQHLSLEPLLLDFLKFEFPDEDDCLFKLVDVFELEEMIYQEVGAREADIIDEEVGKESGGIDFQELAQVDQIAGFDEEVLLADFDEEIDFGAAGVTAGLVEVTLQDEFLPHVVQDEEGDRLRVEIEQEEAQGN